MDFSNKLKKNVLLNVPHFLIKKNYSISFYTGGIKISDWQGANDAERQEALKKDWYIRWSYRHPKTGKLTKQPHIKAGVNRFKNAQQRFDFLKYYKKGMIESFEDGITPYSDDPTNTDDNIAMPTVFTAMDDAMEIKRLHMKPASFTRFKSDIGKFRAYLKKNGYENKGITDVTKKMVNDFLNDILKSVSARSRNNYRSNMSSLWQNMEDNGVIERNFVKSIPMLKSVPKRNKTYTDNQVLELFAYMEAHNPELLLFIKFVSYNFLRPLEVCRLTVRSFNLKARTLTVMVKQGRDKTKVVPSILFDELPDMENVAPYIPLFGKYGILTPWNVTEDRKRAYYSAEFRKVKQEFGLGEEYTLYGFRHYHISKLYRSMAIGLSPFEVKSKLMEITGHSTISALDKYLRSIDAHLPDDWSEML